MITLDSNIIVETEFLGSNNSIVCTREGLVLIDSPHRPSDAMRWRRTVDGCGEALYLINTDHHPDHTIGNFFLPGRVLSHEITRERLLNAAPSKEYLSDLLDVIDPAGKMFMQGYSARVPTITFSDRMALNVGGLDFELTHLPGHTLNSIMIYLPQQKIAFTGDLVCEAGLPAFVEADTFAWIEAVKHIERMDIRYIIPGHGKVCDLDTARMFRHQIEELVGEIERRIDRGEPREHIAQQVSYEDRIHIATADSPGYPQHLIDHFMVRSIEAVHDHILRRREKGASQHERQLQVAGE